MRRLDDGLVVGAVVLAAVIALWWLAAGQRLVDALTRPGGVLVDRPHVLR